MAWSTFFFLFTISSFRAWTESQTGVIPLQAAPAPPARDAKESTACSHQHRKGATALTPVLLLSDLLGFLGPKVQNTELKSLQTFRCAQLKNFLLKRALHSPHGAEADLLLWWPA